MSFDKEDYANVPTCSNNNNIHHSYTYSSGDQTLNTFDDHKIQQHSGTIIITAGPKSSLYTRNSSTKAET